MLLRQLKQPGDMIGRLMAAEALGKQASHKTIAALKETLGNDEFYGVRIAAAKSLAQMATDEAFEALADSLQQDDARVRLQVVESLGTFYRPQTRQILQQVVENQPNPAVVAAAVKSLGKFPAEEVRRTIQQALATESFGDEIAAAAAIALGQSGDVELRTTMLNLLKSKRREFDSRRYAEALEVLAKLWREADDKSPARSWIEDCLQDQARRIRSGAIAALGELNDPQAIAALQSFVDSEASGRDVTAARGAIEKLQKQAPFVPREVQELRKLVDDLKNEQQKLQQEVTTLKEKLSAINAPPDENSESEEE